MSSKWILIPAVLLLAAVLAVFVWVTDAPSYLGTRSETCNNCHVMDAAYENWFHAPHERWATCSDCHIPHDNFIDYYFYKGKSGMRDVFSFVTGSYPAAIRANRETIAIVQSNCVRCHIDTVEGILNGPQPLDRNCWDCHRTAAHGERGLSLSPYQDSEVYDQ